MTSLTAPRNYAYPNARIMAMKGALLKETDIKALISVKDLKSYVALLEHTPYRKNFSNLERINIDSIENALFIHLINIKKKVLDIVPSRAEKFFAEFFKRYEIELLKIIITNSNRTKVDYSNYYPVLSMNVKKVITQIVESRSITDIIKLLKKTEYARFIEETPVSGEQILSVITTLDRYYLENLWKTTEDLSKMDREIARKITGTEIDITNIMTILRAIKGNYGADKFIIPIGYGLKDIGQILGLRNIADLVSKLSNTPYGDVLKKSLNRYEETNSLLPFELNLKNYLLQKAKDLFTGYLFHIGIPLGFIIMKEMEVENLRAIAMGIDSKFPIEEIEDMIVM